MERNEVKTYKAEIFIAGDVSEARNICRKFCADVGFCVTITPTDYVYTGGMESGVIVGVINYPRFPSSETEIWRNAMDLAEKLRIGLFQHSFTVCATDKAVWFSERKQ